MGCCEKVAQEQSATPRTPPRRATIIAPAARVLPNTSTSMPIDSNALINSRETTDEEISELAQLSAEARLWTLNINWLALRVFFIESYVRNVVFQITRNSSYYLLFVPAAFIAGLIALFSLAAVLGLFNPFATIIALGWVFPVESPTSGLWLWKKDVGWLWTDKEIYPFLYKSSTGGWLYFYGIQKDTLLLYEYSTKRWITLQQK